MLVEFVTNFVSLLICLYRMDPMIDEVQMVNDGNVVDVVINDVDDGDDVDLECVKCLRKETSQYWLYNNKFWKNGKRGGEVQDLFEIIELSYQRWHM